MKHYQLTITSKNKKSFANFFKFLSKSLGTDFSVINKSFKKKEKKKFLTILKSPHVNKTAQEQFEYRYFSKTISIYSSQSLKLLLLLKQIILNLFPDIIIKIKFVINKNLSGKTKTNVFNPGNFKGHCLDDNSLQINSLKNISSNKANQYNSQKNTINFLKIVDFYGESL